MERIVGSLSLVIDGEATDRGALQALISQFNNLPGSGRFLYTQGYSGNLTITDNVSSRIVTTGNYNTYFKNPRFLRDFRALSQARGRLAIIFNPNNRDTKPKINILVHEIGHFKWPNLGPETSHDPRFYALLNNALMRLGLKLNSRQDLEGTDVSRVNLPLSAQNDPLGFSFVGSMPVR